MRALRRVVAINAGRINDRNVLASSGTTDDETLHAETMRIQALLSEAAGAMPMGWWDVETHVQAVPTDPYSVHEHLMAQMWYWQTQAFLHLPFMLKPSPNSDSNVVIVGDGDIYQVNRVHCFQGCTGMLKIFNLLRSEPSLAVYICNCDDFQGVLTACILLVGLLFRESLCPDEADENAHRALCAGLGEVEDSLALIEETKDVFRYRAQKQGGFISKQGLRVLTELGCFIDDTKNIFDGEPKRRVVIMPYFGTIHLEFVPSTPLISRYQDVNGALGQGTNMPPGMLLTPPISSNEYCTGGFTEDDDVAAAAGLGGLNAGHGGGQLYLIIRRWTTGHQRQSPGVKLVRTTTLATITTRNFNSKWAPWEIRIWIGINSSSETNSDKIGTPRFQNGILMMVNGLEFVRYIM